LENIFEVFPVVTSERLMLRAMKRDDAESIYQILSDPEVIRYDTVDLFTSIDQAKTLIDYFQQAYNKKKAIFWGISMKNDSKIIGFCKCEIECPGVRVDLGYDLNSAYWNRGIMTEALEVLIDFIWSDIKVNRIEAAVSTNNKSSIRVLEKVGFQCEGILRERSFFKGKYHDMMMLSLLKKDCIENVL